MVDQYNVLAKSFRSVRDLSIEDTPSDFTLRLFRNQLKDPKVYNMSSSNEIVAVPTSPWALLTTGNVGAT